MSKDVMDSAFWLKQGEEDILEPWYSHMIDKDNGLFHIKMDREWNPLDFEGKAPWVISRQVFSLAVGYLLYGKDKYLEQARIAVDWLLEYAWDKEYGGWYDLLSADGKVLDDNKSQFNYMYADTGLIFYYFVTRDKRALDIVNKSNQIRLNNWWDQEKGGYVKELNRDLSVSDSYKDFGGQFVQLSGPGLYHYLATGDEKILKQLEETVTTSYQHMIDPEYGWIMETFDRDWNYIDDRKPGYEVDLGHNVEAAWCAFRLSELTGNKDLVDKFKKFVEKAFKWGFDKNTGLLQYRLPRANQRAEKTYTHWWVQEYANFINLYLYKLTEDKYYLDRFKQTAGFWNQYFIDKEYGAEYLSVELEENNINREQRPRTAYHSAEHVMLVSMYLDFFVNNKEMQLNFNLSASEGEKHFVSPLEDKDIKVKSVKIDGQDWKKFNADERYIELPAGENMKIEVTLKKE